MPRLDGVFEPIVKHNTFIIKVFTTFDILKREIIHWTINVARFARKSWETRVVFETHGNSVAMRIFIPFCPFMHLSYFLGK